MDLTAFLALGEPLKNLLLPIIFITIVCLYRVAVVVLKLHINDKVQDLQIEQLKKQKLT